MGLQRLAQAGRVNRPGGSPRTELYQWNNIEEWFLRRGMPTVARSSSGFRNTVLRASPVLFGSAIIYLLLTMIDVAWRAMDPDAYALDDIPAWYLVAMLVAFVIAIVAGWLANRYVRRHSLRVRDADMITIGVPLLLVLLPVLDVLLGIDPDLLLNLVGNLTIMVIVIAMTKIGFGAIFVWSIRRAVSQGMAVASMAARALPLILLVTLFAFLSDGMWIVTSSLSRDDLWQVVTILLLIAGGFVLVVIRDEMRTMMRGASCTAQELEDQQFPVESLAIDQREADTTLTMTRWETFNATAILIISQAIQIGFLVTLVFGFFCLFGSVTIADTVLEGWTGHPPTPGNLMGFELPVSNEVVHTSLFLAAFSAVNFAASSVSDPRYRESFFDPLVKDVQVTVTARNLYYASDPPTATAPSPTS